MAVAIMWSSFEQISYNFMYVCCKSSLNLTVFLCYVYFDHTPDIADSEASLGRVATPAFFISVILDK